MTLETLITQLEAAAREATPGPWRSDGDGDVWTEAEKEFCPGANQEIFRTFASTVCGPDRGDAKYIALCSPETILQLTQALREAVHVAHFYAEWADDTEANEDAIKSKTFGDKARAFLARWKGEG